MPQRRHANRPGTPVRVLATIICCTALAGCSSMNSMLGGSSEKDALNDLKWSYSDDGVQIQVHADPALNQSSGQPHMLALSVVQMEDPNAFTALTANAAKLKTLLLADSPPPGVLSVQRIYIAPGEVQTLKLQRVEKAKYIGLAAGYDHLDPARCARLYRIGVQVDSSGLIIKTRSAAPEPLKIDLRLGPEGIQESPGSKPAPVDPSKPEAGLVTPPAAAPATASPTSHGTTTDTQ